MSKGTENTVVKYTGKVLDQYGTEITEVVTSWYNISAPSGVIVSGATITVTNSAQTGDFTLTATSGDKSEDITINTVDVAFTGEPTIKTDPVYDDTWGDIVTGLTNITANIGEELIQGTYTLENANTMLTVGEQTYKVLFTRDNGTYTNIVAAADTVNIVSKPVTVTGITAADKEYDGTINATLDLSKASVTGMVGEDMLTVTSATGAFDSENAGSQTVTITNITLGDRTYTDTPVTSGNVTVGKKLVVVAALDRNISIGQKAPDLSQPRLGTDYTATGLVGTDTLGGTIVMSYDPVEPDTSKFGTAVINISGTTVGENYDIVFQSGKLTIPYIPPYIPRTGGNSNTQVNPNGSTTTTTTSSNGTVSQTTKYPDGSQTEVVTALDGSASITTTTADGIWAVTTVDATGKAVSNITLSRFVMNGVGTKHQPVVLPMPAATNADNILGAVAITVNLPAGVESAWVEIPVQHGFLARLPV